MAEATHGFETMQSDAGSAKETRDREPARKAGEIFKTKIDGVFFHGNDQPLVILGFPFMENTLSMSLGHFEYLTGNSVSKEVKTILLAGFQRH